MFSLEWRGDSGIYSRVARRLERLIPSGEEIRVFSLEWRGDSGI